MPVEESSREARAQSWCVFALVLLSASYFYQSSSHNEAARFDQIRAVVEHGEWSIDRFAENTGDVVEVNGRTFPNKAPGSTLIGLAPWVAARAFFSLFPIDESQQLILTTYALTILLSALPTALVSLMILRLLASTGSTLIHATLISLGYGLGSIAFPFATMYFGHQLAAFFGFGAFYLIWVSKDEPATRGRTLRLAISGGMLGFLPVIEYPGAMVSGLVILYALIKLKRAALPIIVGAMVGVLPLPLYNLMAFGSIQALGYSFYSKEGSRFPAHRVGLMGVSFPRLDVLAEITFRKQRGLFYANPWLAFSLLTPFLWRKAGALKHELILAAAIFAAFLTFNAGFGDSIVYWGGAFSFGPRHLLIALPFAALLVALPMKVRRLDAVIGAAIVVSICLMLPAVAVNPRLPYEPADPFTDFYFPLYARALFGLHPLPTFDGSTMFQSSGAFNVGRLFHVPPTLEILPLTLAWAIAAWLLFRTASRVSATLRVGVGALFITLGLAPAVGPAAPWRHADPGFCRSVSTDAMWEFMSDHSLQAEPSNHPRRDRVLSTLLTVDDASSPPASLAATFRGYYEPPSEGYYILGLTSVGEVSLYVDGLRRLHFDDANDTERAQKLMLFLSRRPHELIVRYMSDRPERKLELSLQTGKGADLSLLDGLSSGTCR